MRILELINQDKANRIRKVWGCCMPTCHHGGKSTARFAALLDSQRHNPSRLPVADSSNDTGSSGIRELPLTNESLEFSHYSNVKIGCACSCALALADALLRMVTLVKVPLHKKGVGSLVGGFRKKKKWLRTVWVPYFTLHPILLVISKCFYTAASWILFHTHKEEEGCLSTVLWKWTIRLFVGRGCGSLALPFSPQKEQNTKTENSEKPMTQPLCVGILGFSISLFINR